MKLGEFFIDLMVDAGSGELTVSNLVTKMGELEAATVGALGVVFELGAKLAQFTDISIKTSLGLEDYATLTGKSTMELQKWQRVAEHAHVAGSSVTKMFTGMNASLAGMRLNLGPGKLQALVDYLHLDLTKITKPEQIAEFIRHSKAFADMSAEMRTEVLKKAEIDPLLARAFLMPTKEFGESTALVAGISEEAQENFTNMATTLSDISTLVKQIGTDISEWDAGPILEVLHAAKSVLGAFGAFSKLYHQASSFAEFGAHPTAGKSANAATDFLLSPFLRVLTGAILRSGAELTTPAMQHAGIPPTPSAFGALSAFDTATAPKTEVHVHNNFNGVQTPEAIQKAAEKTFDQKWGQKIGDHAQAAGKAGGG